MSNKIMVGMADMKVSKHPGMLVTLGLGSCVGICLYDPSSKVAGMAHCMLPDSTQIVNNENVAKFVDTAVIRLVNDMARAGANKRSIVAKLAGGAQMFAFTSTTDTLRIGDRNVDAAVKVLKQLNIPLKSMDVRENYGRTIELHTDDGRLTVKTIGKGTKVI
ncbi:MAG: chemotaxis protein CheD [Clostridiales bacterium]|jgi:chemotaxis protein CheD|nr:chemotaxis protein CheD [Clostridiales bacterium]